MYKVYGKLFHTVTIGFIPFQAQIGKISVKRIQATSAYEQQGEN